jgi:hypothetical protein
MRIFLFRTAALIAAAALFFAACDISGSDDGDGDNGNTLPASKGTNALSGKTFFRWDEKIEFSTTAADAENGTYKIFSVKKDNNGSVLKDGKFDYVETENGYYSWDEPAKTITTSPEKADPERNHGEIGPLQTKSEYRARVQQEVEQYINEDEEAFMQIMADHGFSSVADYIDYTVAGAFRNITRNYAFSADSRVLFLDGILPENKGTNELSGQTYYGMSWDEDEDKEVKDPNKKYVFTAAGCSYTYSFTDDNGDPQTENETYVYTYDSAQKKVYLKVPVTDRDSMYASVVGNTTNSGHFVNPDAYNAAGINGKYGRHIEEFRYNIADKTLWW